MRDIHIPFQPSKRQKETMIKELGPKLKKYAQEETLKELGYLRMSHAMNCNNKCGGGNNNDCDVREWLHGYVEAFKEEMIK